MKKGELAAPPNSRSPRRSSVRLHPGGPRVAELTLHGYLKLSGIFPLLFEIDLYTEVSESALRVEERYLGQVVDVFRKQSLLKQWQCPYRLVVEVR